jgi:Protein of unknown function (DUF3667)
MKNYCRNCHHPLPFKAKFCAQCGQKNTDGKVQMTDLLARLWRTTFHVDNKFLRGMLHLCIPGRVTKAYFLGQQRRYPHPLQWLAIALFFFLFLVGPKLSRENTFNNPTYYDQGQKIGTLIDGLQRQSVYEELRNAWDSLPPDMRHDTAYWAVTDSLWRIANRKWASVNDEFMLPGDTLPPQRLDSFPITCMGQLLTKIAVRDLTYLSEDSLLHACAQSSWYKRIIIRQSVRTIKDPYSMGRVFTGNFIWIILSLTGIMAAVLWILYRKKRYFVEHFVFMLHLHTFSVFLFFIIISLKKALEWINYRQGHLGYIFTGTVLLYLLLAMRRYYEQAWWKTIVKYIIFMPAYLFFLILTIMLGFGFAYLLS